MGRGKTIEIDSTFWSNVYGDWRSNVVMNGAGSCDGNCLYCSQSGYNKPEVDLAMEIIIHASIEVKLLRI